MTRDSGRGSLLIALVIAPLACCSPAIAAAPADADPSPLRPADASSPRDTLRSFLGDTREWIDDWRRGEMKASSFRAHDRAVETLDLSTTPHGDSSSVQTLRVLLLKEILDRIALPPEAEIPGDAEVADGSLKRWVVPGTRITLARSLEGPREGEFLFSADTVAQLDRLYRQVQSLPYVDGASDGIYEEFLQSSRSWYVAASEVRSRLRPIDASSPLSTLEGFLETVNRAYELVMEADAALRAEPPTMTKEEALEVEARADQLVQRAVGALDLRKVPSALRGDVGVESVLKLKEILDRVPLPPLESVPDAERVAADRRDGVRAPLHWRIPNTDIELVEILEGERTGDFLFGADTIGRLPRSYEEVRDLPYRKDDHAALAGEYRSAEVSPGFYTKYVSTPGHLVPRAHFLGGLLDHLPDWMLELRGGNTVWQWLSLLLMAPAVGLAGFLVYRLVRGIRRRIAPPGAYWLPLVTPAVIALLVVRAIRFLDDDVNLTGELLVVVTTGGELIVLALAAWVAFIVCRAAAETLIASPRIPEQSIDASLIRISARVVAFLIAAWIVVDGVRGLGADVVPLLAGLGVGGLAVALAAQTTLANFIGSLILFATKPIRVGDFCRYGDEIGTVEQIGLHATRIRTLERSVVTVPNAEFSQMKIDNFSKRDLRLFTGVLQLRYETTPEQMRWLLAKLRELLLGHPMVTPDPARARFVGFGAYSKDVEIFAYLRCRDHDIFLAIREDILLRMERLVLEAGSGFAFPSQTSYLVRDEGVDVERREEVEAQVESWRSEQRLPFPEFADEERRRLTDVLDYPPEGSPDHRPRQEETAPDEPGDRPPAFRWPRFHRNRRPS